jgi:cholesterol oxidase
MPERFDVVIIGSGFGGGTTALRLAQAGKSVCVLERGRRWRGKNLPVREEDPKTNTFPELGDKHFFWGRQFWRPTRQRLGLFEIKQMTNMQGLVGAGVGGGSLIWANVVVKPPASVFEKNWPAGITLQSLERYYRQADPYLRPTLIPGIGELTDKGDGRFNRRTNLLRLAAEKVGRSWSPVEVAVNFGDESQATGNGHGRARQLGCNLCGLCSAGCPQNAKNTVDITYISAAEALGAVVRPLHLVTGIEPSEQGYRVHFKRFTPEGVEEENGFVEGKRVVLSAGTFGTTELLLKCKAKGLLPKLSSALGSRFSINGNVVSGALKERQSKEPACTNLGPAIAGIIDYGAFAIEDFADPYWLAGMLGTSNVERIKAFALALLGFKERLKAITAEKAKRDLLVYVGVGDDGARGRLVLNSLGKLSLQWPGGVGNEPGIQELSKAMAQLSAAQGRKYVPNVFSVFNRPVTYHPLGGCPMSDSPETGVVDSWGRVFGYPGLHVADGSIVPSALGRNPSYTIAALSERVAERMVTDWQ